MATESKLLQIVGDIYEAAVDPQIWPVVLEQFADLIGGSCTSIGIYDHGRHDGNLIATARMDPEFQRKYDEYYIGVDCWGIEGGHLVRSGSIVTGQMLCPDSILEQSEFCSDFLRPMGVFHQLLGVLRKEDSALCFVSSLRSKRAGPFNEQDRTLLGTLMPHLQRAIKLRREQTLHKLKADVIDLSPAGILLVNRAGKVIWANRAGQVILNRRDGLWIDSAGVVSAHRNRNSRLEALISRASDTTEGRGLSPGGVLAIPRDSRTPYAITVSPLPTADRFYGAQRPSAVIFVSELDPSPQAGGLLRELFSLTPQEARLVNAMMAGKSLKEACEELRISRTTGVSHLKHVFEKTGTRRQGELLALVFRTIDPLRHILKDGPKAT